MKNIFITNKKRDVQSKDFTSLLKTNINQQRSKGMQQYRYPADCASIIDVTKPPYNADPTGKEDCTAIFCAISVYEVDIL